MRNILERLRWNVPILHISIIFRNVSSDETFFFFFIHFILEISFNFEKRESYFSI